MDLLDELIAANRELADVDAQREQAKQRRDALVVKAFDEGIKWRTIEDLNLPGLTRGNLTKIKNRHRS